MSYLKRLFTVVTALALLAGLVVPAAAAPRSYTEITLDQPVFPNVYAEECYLRFTPEADGWYGFYSISTGMDPKVRLWNDDMELFDDNGCGNRDFLIKAQLKVGQIYYLRASWDGDPNQTLVVQAAPLDTAQTLELNSGVISGHVGETFELQAATGPILSIPEKVTFVSSDPAVATVDANGYVSLVSPGTATVTATSESGLTATCSVTVTGTDTLLCGQSVVVNEDGVRFRFVPEKDGWYCFFSTDAEGDPYCEVLDEWMDWLDANGNGPDGNNFKVTVNLQAGQVYYLQTHDDVGGSFTVHVEEASNATAIYLPDSMEGELGDTLYLQTIFEPSYARQEAVNWTSSDEAVASVNAYGEVTLKAAGTAEITATTTSGLTATCIVTVRGTETLVCGQPVDLKNGDSRWFSFTPDREGWYRFRSEGQNADPYCKLYNADRNEQLAYGDDNNDLFFQIDYYMQAGITYCLQVEFYNYGDDGQCRLSVDELVSATGMTLSATEITNELYRYEHIQAILEPANAIEEAITWTSSNEDIVQVHNGDLWMLNIGTAVITATSESGLTATCTVTVRDPEVLVCDQILTCGAEGGNHTFRFVPETSGWYGFYTTGNMDTNLELYGQDYEYWYDDDSGMDWNALLRAELTAGNTYYLSVNPTVAEELYTLQVTKLPAPTQLILKNRQLVIYEGCDAYVGDYQVLPYPATVPALSWSSSNEDVIQVDYEGYVTAQKPGTAVLTATTDGGLTDTLEVTVLSAPEDVDAFGSCGATLLYTCTDGSLTITGSGDMWDNWFYEDCQQVVLPQGLTSICGYAFSDSNLTSIEIPATVTSIGARAFVWSALAEIRFLGSAPQIGAGAFEELTVTAYYPAGDPSWTEEVMLDYSGNVTWVPYVPENADRYTLSGSFTTFTDAEVSLQLLQGDLVIVSTVATGKTGDYELPAVPAGSYTVRISKAGHVTRTYEVTLAENTSLDVKLHLPGDISGDGKLNVGDTSKVYAHAKGAILIEDAYLMACADVNGDGKINVADTSKLYAHAKGTTLLW